MSLAEKTLKSYEEGKYNPRKNIAQQNGLNLSDKAVHVITGIINRLYEDRSQ